MTLLREDFKKKRVYLVTSYILGLKPTLLPLNSDIKFSDRVERQSVTSYQNDMMMEYLDVIASVYGKMK